MTSAVCTLFEGDYHIGVAALLNSLHASGYEGTVFVGYRGRLPNWASGGNVELGTFPNSSSKNGTGIQVSFVHLKTDYHLTNFKPFFMLDLLNGPASNATKIFYFDPDICVVSPWLFFELWIENGVGVCENNISPLLASDPRRSIWSRDIGVPIAKTNAYFNAGFVGLQVAHIGLLQAWASVLLKIAKSFGGPQVSPIFDTAHVQNFQSNAWAYEAADQDALNIALGIVGDLPISARAKDAMGFTPGMKNMHHFLGSPKLWNKKHLRFWDRKNRADPHERLFWKFTRGPLTPFSTSRFRLRAIRFYVGLTLSYLTRPLFR